MTMTTASFSDVPSTTLTTSAIAETHAQCRNAEQVGNNNGKVQRMDAHRVFFSAAPLDAAEKCVEDSGAREPASRKLCGIWAWVARVVQLFRFAHLRCTRRYDCRAFSHMLFPCATFWDLTAAARKRIAS